MSDERDGGREDAVRDATARDVTDRDHAARRRTRDAADEVLAQLSPQIEPPPMSRPVMPVPYAYPIPFGEPPAEPVTLVEGEIPWELREEE